MADLGLTAKAIHQVEQVPGALDQTAPGLG
jgi:hypothetical protein